MSDNPDFICYHNGVTIYADDEGNFYYREGEKKVIWISEQEMKEYLDDGVSLEEI